MLTLLSVAGPLIGDVEGFHDLVPMAAQRQGRRQRGDGTKTCGKAANGAGDSRTTQARGLASQTAAAATSGGKWWRSTHGRLAPHATHSTTGARHVGPCDLMLSHTLGALPMMLTHKAYSHESDS